MKLGLSARIVLIFMLLAAALLATVGVLSYRSASESLKAAVMSKMLAVGLEKQAVLDGWFGQHLTNIGQLASNDELVQKTADVIGGASMTSEAHALLEHELAERANGYIELFIIDPNSGKVLASTNPAEEGKSKIGHPYFENGKTNIYLQTPYQSTDLKAPAMSIGAPVYRRNGQLLAVLAARLDFSAMSTITQRRTGLHSTEDSYLVNSARFLVTQPRFMSEPAILRRRIDTEAVRDCIAGNSGTVLATDYRGIPVISVYRWIAKYQLGLLVEIDQAEALAPALALKRSVFWISGLALFATAIFALLLARTITRPLRQLHEKVKHFAEKNSEQPLSETSGNDLVLLSDAFTEMEGRVEQRTKELAHSLSLLNATLDSTADGIAAIQLTGEMISVNSQCAAMWGIPADVMGRDSREMIAVLCPQLCDPEKFVREIETLFANPDDEKLDILKLVDGRTIERYAKPQRIDGKTVGLVVNFRDVTERNQAQAEIESIHKQLVDASRQAGKAEIATNVLHNVGNVLNSVNVSATLVTDSITKSKISGLAKAVALLEEHKDGLGDYLSADPRGKLLPAYLAQLSEQLQADQQESLKELKFLGQNIEHIKEIVAMQQAYAGTSNTEEVVNVGDLVEEALRVNMDHKLEVVREITDLPPVRIDKHKVLQILVNMMSNAKHACYDSNRTDKRMTLKVGNDNNRISVAVIDNGIGIPVENLTKIFNHGFTTKKDGHGFGLHSAALTAKQMGGSLRAQSDGIGQGATFTLELPIEPLEILS